MARFAISFGRFDRADAQLAAYIEAHPTRTEELPVAEGLRVFLAEERGDRAALDKRITEFLARQSAWAPDATRLDGRLFAAQRRAGLVSVEESRGAVRRWRHEVEPTFRNRELRWVTLWAATVVSPEDAREALDAWNLDDAAARGSLTVAGDPDRWLDVGRTHLLADKVDEAIVELGRASRACRALSDPFLAAQSARLLGDALARKGDAAGACAAYASVIARWGHATPRSVTAEAARDGMKRLLCENHHSGAR
jgi:serine/threonine-protein kinase